jgi:hypothetical protein
MRRREFIAGAVAASPLRARAQQRAKVAVIGCLSTAWQDGAAGLIKQPGPEDPGQFSFADPERVRRILERLEHQVARLSEHHVLTELRAHAPIEHVAVLGPGRH